MSPKQRIQLKTIIIVGEGDTEKAFLDFLKSEFHQRGCGKTVKIVSTDGGSPENILEYVIKQCQSADYSEIYLLIDTDVTWPLGFKEKAESFSIMLLPSKPCIESFFLTLLDEGYDWTTRSTRECKKVFHDNHLAEDQKTESKNYKKIFTRDELIEKSSNSQNLKILINCLQ